MFDSSAETSYAFRLAPMEFTAVILFLILYFVRLHDWVPGLAGLNVIKPVIALGLLGLLSRERRKPQWGWMRTPHEWVMAAYLLHCIYVDADWYTTFTDILPFAAFFFLTSQALTSEERLDKYFSWWAACIAFMCAIGAATDMGIDITGARELIEAKMGRLSLNTWLMDNPNALGHTAVTAFPLIYCTMIFRRGIGSRILAVPVFILVTVCVLATESKGAYLSAAAGIVAVLLIGRSFMVQIVLAVLLVLAGSAVTTMLPRMVDKEMIRYDEGAMGRAMAFKAAKDTYETAPTGYKDFLPVFEWEGQTVELASHSSIVQIGADLGPVGLFLYLSVLACSARSLFQYQTASDELERARRLIFSLTVMFFVSGWMINRSYHTEFFIIAGAAVAYHKLARESKLREAGLVSEEDEESAPAGEPAPLLAVTPAAGGGEGGFVIEQREDVPARSWRWWNRYGLVDFGITYGLLAFTLWLWGYIVDYFLET